MKWFLIFAAIWAIVSFIISFEKVSSNGIKIEINNKNFTPNFWGKWLVIFLVPLIILLIFFILVPILLSIVGLVLVVVFAVIFVSIATVIIIYIFRLFI